MSRDEHLVKSIRFYAQVTCQNFEKQARLIEQAVLQAIHDTKLQIHDTKSVKLRRSVRTEL